VHGLQIDAYAITRQAGGSDRVASHVLPDLVLCADHRRQAVSGRVADPRWLVLDPSAARGGLARGHRKAGPASISARTHYTHLVPDPVAAVVATLEAEPSVRLAVLFGSAARGTFASTSDIDVGVIGPDVGRLPSLAVTLERASGRTVDLTALEQAPPLLRFEIARDGRVLLERTPHLWSDFKARAMIDWWDWAPFARRFQQAAAARLRAQVLRGPS
jgi:uncharacterized protein